jgi:hypothetical protein
MKIISAVFVMALVGATAGRADISASLAKRLDEAAAVLRELRDIPDKSVPEDVWNKAACRGDSRREEAALGIGGEYEAC